MTFAICDKNNKRCEYVHDMLNDYMNDHKINTKIYSFFNPNILLNELEDGNNFDYLLVDEDSINFSKCSKLINLYNRKMTVICLISSPNYKNEDNIFYINKKQEKPWLEIDHILSKTLNNRRFVESLGCYVIKKSNRMIRIAVSDIMYIEHVKSDNIIHMKNHSIYSERKTMLQAENEINNNVFVRCHRSFAVNMMHVQELTASCFVMKNGDTIPISKKEFSRVRDSFLRFCYTDINRMDK